jgi:hypothetical protein
MPFLFCLKAAQMEKHFSQPLSVAFIPLSSFTWLKPSHRKLPFPPQSCTLSRLPRKDGKNRNGKLIFASLAFTCKSSPCLKPIRSNQRLPHGQAISQRIKICIFFFSTTNHQTKLPYNLYINNGNNNQHPELQNVQNERKIVDHLAYNHDHYRGLNGINWRQRVKRAAGNLLEDNELFASFESSQNDGNKTSERLSLPTK